MLIPVYRLTSLGSRRRRRSPSQDRSAGAAEAAGCKGEGEGGRGQEAGASGLRELDDMVWWM